MWTEKTYEKGEALTLSQQKSLKKNKKSKIKNDKKPGYEI